MSETVQLILDVPRKFYKDSVHLINRCTKPDKKGTNMTILDSLIR